MHTMLKISTLCLVSALTPLLSSPALLMADSSASNAAVCQSGIYVGANVVEVSKGTSIFDNDRNNGTKGDPQPSGDDESDDESDDEDEDEGDIETIDAIEGTDLEARYKASKAKTSKGSAVAFVENDKVVLAATEVGDDGKSNIDQKDAEAALKDLNAKASLKGKTLQVAGAPDLATALEDNDEILGLFSEEGAAPKAGKPSVGVSSNKKPEAEKPAGVRSINRHLDGTQWGFEGLVGYQRGFGNGFIGAVEFAVGWTGGKCRAYSYRNGGDSNDFPYVKGGVFFTPMVWGRYALHENASVGLGLGVNFARQSYYHGQDKGKDKNGNNRDHHNMTFTHFRVAGELAATIRGPLSVVARVFYDVPATKNIYDRNDNDYNDNKGNNRRGRDTGERMRSQGVGASVGIRYLISTY